MATEAERFRAGELVERRVGERRQRARVVIQGQDRRGREAVLVREENGGPVLGWDPAEVTHLTDEATNG